MVWNKQESRRKYWATRLSVRLFARTAHSFARLLTSLTPSLVGKWIFDVSKWPGFVPKCIATRPGHATCSLLVKENVHVSKALSPWPCSPGHLVVINKVDFRGWEERGVHLFYFIRTPNFSPRLDVLIFSAISASNCSYDVLKYLTIKIRYLYSTTVYLLLNTIVFSLNYKMKWS